MSRRFFFRSDSSQRPEVNDSVILDSREAHHLIHVMRTSVGDRLRLFDGSGYEFEGEIAEIGRSDVTVRILSCTEVNRELDAPLVVALPFPKADRQKFLVEKLAEIGVSSLVFLNTMRAGEQGNQKTLTKLQQIVIEASKQCGRNQLMTLQGPIGLEQLIEKTGDYCDNEAHRFFAHIDTEASSSDLRPVENPGSGQSQIVTIGPEGGFDSKEIELLIQNKWQPIGLGKTILRMETAAVVAATLLSRT